jgi:hypothetical protein
LTVESLLSVSSVGVTLPSLDMSFEFPSLTALSVKSEFILVVSPSESNSIPSDETIPFELSFISLAEIAPILMNNINAKIRVKCIFFDIFTPPF